MDSGRSPQKRFPRGISEWRATRQDCQVFSTQHSTRLESELEAFTVTAVFVAGTRDPTQGYEMVTKFRHMLLLSLLLFLHYADWSPTPLVVG